jgi:hypothetical protein
MRWTKYGSCGFMFMKLQRFDVNTVMKLKGVIRLFARQRWLYLRNQASILILRGSSFRREGYEVVRYGKPTVGGYTNESYLYLVFAAGFELELNETYRTQTLQN